MTRLTSRCAARRRSWQAAPCFDRHVEGNHSDMTKNYNVGDDVEWDWGSGTAKGKITDRFTDKVTKTIKGNEVTRNASEDEPAFMIEQEDGDEVLKSVTEIRRA